MDDSDCIDSTGKAKKNHQMAHHHRILLFKLLEALIY